MSRFITFILISVLGFETSASAAPLDGQKQIYALDSSDHKILIGRVNFMESEGAVSYTIDLSTGPFAEHFLSMRPFRCLEGPDKHWCHVPYPYTLRRQVSQNDLTDLEYDLLFIHKGATEYGIDMWNGVYYQLRIDGDHLFGTLHEMDMGLLSAPPEDGNLRPVSEQDIHVSDADSHWLPQLIIE